MVFVKTEAEAAHCSGEAGKDGILHGIIEGFLPNGGAVGVEGQKSLNHLWDGLELGILKPRANVGLRSGAVKARDKHLSIGIEDVINRFVLLPFHTRRLGIELFRLLGPFPPSLFKLLLPGKNLGKIALRLFVVLIGILTRLS